MYRAPERAGPVLNGCQGAARLGGATGVRETISISGCGPEILVESFSDCIQEY